jgi:hypothetical protein
MANVLPADREATFWSGVEEASRFFMGEADVQRALARLAEVLDREGIPYAILGAMALNEWGYRRVTVDVDVLLTAEGLRKLRDVVLGRGYVEKFPGSRGIRDAVAGVDIDVVLTGEYPGDGRPKPVAFPDPAEVAVRGRGIALLALPKLIELKLASGLSAPHRLRDLADVLELVRVLSLPRELGGSLDPSVRAKYEELWLAAQTPDPGESRRYSSARQRVSTSARQHVSAGSASVLKARGVRTLRRRRGWRRRRPGSGRCGPRPSSCR